VITGNLLWAKEKGACERSKRNDLGITPAPGPGKGEDGEKKNEGVLCEGAQLEGLGPAEEQNKRLVRSSQGGKARTSDLEHGSGSSFLN